MRTRVLTWHEEQLIVAREVGNREREGMGSPLPTIACSIKGKKRPGMAIGHSLTELGPARPVARRGGLACLGTRGGRRTVEVKAVDVDEPPVRQRGFRQSYVLPARLSLGPRIQSVPRPEK